MRSDDSLCDHPEQLVDDVVLGEDIRLGEPLDLALTEHMHRFIALDRLPRWVERSKP